MTLARILILLTSVVSATEAAPRTITQVVTLLNDMLDKSKVEGNTERDLYAKYKCYKDTNEAQKNTEIDSLKKEIGLLENRIEETLASTAVLSKDAAQLKRDIADNEASQTEAATVRAAEEAAFIKKEEDLTLWIGDMTSAITALAEVGADQTMSTAADHTQYMADFKAASLVKLKSSVKAALLAASTLVSDNQSAKVEAFLQAPFTATYSAQSGEVVGILKDMRDTFKANLAAAKDAEAKAKKAYLKWKANMEAEHKKMSDWVTEKISIMAGNDEELAAKKIALTTAQDDLADAQAFLSSLLEMYAAKTKQYESRVNLRTQEEAALSQAIAILNSDAAFETFGTVSATKDGPVEFLQLRNIRQHNNSAAIADIQKKQRGKAQAFLAGVARSKGSPLISRVLAMLQANNPFTVVLTEIDKIIDLLAAEEKADTQQKEWCDTTRTETTASISDKGTQITTLEGAIDQLKIDIDDPETGLKKTIGDTETSLEENHENQVTETAARTKENLAYQADVSNLVEATTLLTKAVSILRKYYAKISAEIQADFLQKNKGKEDPAPPATWDDTYEGQSGKGKTAVDMLDVILTNTQAEETQAHADEQTAQHDYEDSMTALKASQEQLLSSLASLKETLASKETTLLEKEKDFAATVKEKETLEAYLLKIKPGCDFITENIDTRQTNRQEETEALQGAKTLLQNSPAYVEAIAVAHNETLGECLSICAGNEAHVDCKSCLAKTSVPGYCAGHPDTEGCS